MDDNKLYEQAMRWRNQAKSHRPDNHYKGNLYDKSNEDYSFYKLPEDYYGLRKRSRPSSQPKKETRPRSRPRQRTDPTPSPPSQRMVFSPLPPPRQPTPPPTQPMIPVTQASHSNSRYPLIPVAPHKPPFFSPEPEEAPIILSSTPINPHRYEPLYKPRPQPMFPPLIAVERSRGSIHAFEDRSYNTRRTYFSEIPGYNAVGSILRSLRMQQR